ncbi:catalase family peroxidase [Microvirga sp. TS319]|uniref:catalase family peroxidase n=1 Tax=Microvirga sp. TS319 TaxID=3241165 RepID=UPI003519E8AF
MRISWILIRLLVLTFAGSGPGWAQEQTVETQVVDAMNQVFGSHPGFRTNHAKGIVVEGRFKGSPEAAALSRAVLFDGRSIPVTVRFSNAGGLPTIPDGSNGANPHGMALKFHLPDGSETDMVTNSFKVFLVPTAADLRDFFLAIAASPPEAPKPTRLDRFVAAHPTIPAALATIATPDSFAHEEYRGLNAFVLVDKAGERQPVRYVVTPEEVVHLNAADAAKRPPDFLMTELPERLSRGPVIFHLKAQLAAAGDPTNDPSRPWPDDRKVVELGILTVDKAVPDSAEAEKKLLFLPGQLTDGIEASDDPMIAVRDGAYAVSFSRRNP